MFYLMSTGVYQTGEVHDLECGISRCTFTSEQGRNPDSVYADEVM